MATGVYDVGDLAEVKLTLRDLDEDLTDALSVKLSVLHPDESVDEFEFGVDGRIAHPSSGIYTARIELGEVGDWSYRWVTDEPTTAEEGSMVVKSSPFFAEVPGFVTFDEVSRRSSGLNRNDIPKIRAMIKGATALISEAAGKDDAWAATLDPVPNVLKELTIQMILRADVNSEGLVSRTESLGQYSLTDRWSDIDGLMLSEQEGRLVRRVVLGRGSGSSRIGSLIDELPDWQDRATPLLEGDELLNP